MNPGRNEACDPLPKPYSVNPNRGLGEVHRTGRQTMGSPLTEDNQCGLRKVSSFYQ